MENNVVKDNLKDLTDRLIGYTDDFNYLILLLEDVSNELGKSEITKKEINNVQGKMNVLISSLKSMNKVSHYNLSLLWKNILKV